MTQQYRMEELELAQIVFDKEVQVRVETDEETAKDYYDAMETEEDMKKFPPLTVYFDGCNYWLADGHHRYWAAFRRGYKKILVKVIDGSHDDAILAAVKLNAQNGLRFNDNDWEKIIPLVTSKKQWSDWSNRKLAEELKCSEITIRRYRQENSGATAVAPGKRRGKDGKLYPSKMNKKPKSKAVASEPTGDTGVSPEKFRDADDDFTPPEQKLETVSTNPSPVMTETIPQPAEEPQRDAFAEAKAGEERIYATIAILEEQINTWFDRAPAELCDEFEDRLRNRIWAMID